VTNKDLQVRASQCFVCVQNAAKVQFLLFSLERSKGKHQMNEFPFAFYCFVMAPNACFDLVLYNSSCCSSLYSRKKGQPTRKYKQTSKKEKERQEGARLKKQGSAGI